MNLRDLCRLPDLPTALLTTFSIDPLFIERVVLTDLMQGGASRIIVLADEEQALAAVAQARGQLMALGRRYRLIPVRRGLSFHPKLCIRIGPAGAVVACGSHNLTRAGWLGCRPEQDGGGNREATFAWRVEPSSPEAAGLHATLEQIARLPQLSADRDELRRTFNIPWLADAENKPLPEGWTWIVVGEETTLAAVLEDRWRGRQFRSLRIVTGSTDDRAAMIRWAAKTFGIKKAVVEVDLSFCGFDPAKLADLGVDLRLQPYDAQPRTHLKIAIFDGPDGCAAVLGSANCSAAAWLRRTRERGNIESVVILDKCDPGAVAHLFRPGHSDPKPWRDIALSPRVPEEIESVKTASYALKSLQLQRMGGRVGVRIAPTPAPDARLYLVIQSSRVPLSAGSLPGSFVGPMPDLVEGPETLFGYVEVETTAGIERTDPHWVDDVDRLAQISGRHHRFDAVRRLSNSGPAGEYRRLLEDLQVLSHALLAKGEEFPDRGVDRSSKDEKSAESKPVTTQEVIRSLADIRASGQAAAGAPVGTGSLSLSGIMAILFSEGSESVADPTEAENERSDEERREKQDEGKSEVALQEDAPSDSQRKRLIAQLGDFIDKLATPSFAANCSARQLQHAAAFPLAVARFASRGPWVQDGERAALAGAIARASEVLFFRSQKIHDPATGQMRRLGPLMEQVRDRYTAEVRVADFDEILGDGTLWLVLIGSLNVLGFGANQFELNLVLRDLAKFGSLLSHAVPGQLVPLAHRLGQETDDALSRAHEVVEAFDALEAYLGREFERFPKAKVSQSRPGDWLWKPDVGFGKIVELVDENTASVHIRKRAETLGRVRLDYYCNLRVVAANDGMLAKFCNACESRCQPAGT